MEGRDLRELLHGWCFVCGGLCSTRMHVCMCEEGLVEERSHKEMIHT